MKIVSLTCEYKDFVLGSDIAVPRFTWIAEGSRRGLAQTAYQIQVSEDPEFGNFVWDSGVVESDVSVNVEYEGEPMRSQTRYYVRVEITDDAWEKSGWSEPLIYETAFMNGKEFKAEWIASSEKRKADPDDRAKGCYLRKEFECGNKPVKARLYATAQGMYDMYINGERVGDQYLTPHWTQYSERFLYQTYDVTEMLQKGMNVVGGVLTDGWYRGRISWDDRKNSYWGDNTALKAELHIWFDNGLKKVIPTDTSWEYTDGAVRFADIWDGEIYDAVLEKPDWAIAGCNDYKWEKAVCGTDTAAVIQADEGLPIKVMNVLEPIEVITTPKGETVLDFGQNMVGWVEIYSSDVKGAVHSLAFAEVLDAEGNFYNENYRSSKCNYIYTGDGTAKWWHPTFTFYGFRYVKILEWPGEVDSTHFRGLVLHSDFDTIGNFECSNPLVNRLQSNIVWGQKGNFVDVPTDCPQRDERLGWTGDAQVFASTACFNGRVNAFYTKWMHDIILTQDENGKLPCVVPSFGNCDAHTGWIDVISVLPWTMWRMYGDKRIVEESYECVKKFIDYMESAGESWRNGWHFGDWVALDVPYGTYVGKTEPAYIAAAFQIYSTGIFVDFAKLLNRNDDIKKYTLLKSKLKQQFRTEYVTNNGHIAQNTQTAHVLALYFDLLEEKDIPVAAADLSALINRDKDHLTTGFLGTPYLNFALSKNGYLEKAYELLQREEYPSWLYPITKGATTMWEHWDGLKPDGTMWSVNMNSFNHYAYGAVGDWMYRVAAGINAAEPGYKKSVICPQPGGELTFIKAGTDTVYGRIESERRETDSGITYDVTIPFNTTSDIVIIGAAPHTISENGSSIKAGNGILSIEEKNGDTIITAGAGNYSFTVGIVSECSKRNGGMV